ncbi:MAG: glutamate-cysteine ligase family protein [Coriobacteriia bacterium]|nr:glutamate-cysteine ligase family protein [Coriobacteriia bacterium]MCL2537045.1 glutamate-cysteine ligase family protein [Coriobacteriia bacterium]
MKTPFDIPKNNEVSESVQLARLDAGVEALVEYFEAGAKPAEKSKLGFELEQIIVDKNDYSVPYTGEPGASGTHGCTKQGGCSITSILKRLSPLYDSEIHAHPDDPSSPLLGLIRPDATITLEPGAQFEYSSMPFWRLEDLNAAFTRFQAELTEVTGQLGYQPLTVGYHPKTKVRDITLLPKERYKMMNEHFKSTGQHGINMMRGSASTQVTIDYHDEADAIMKMRVAAAITPLLSLLTDNTARFENEPVEDYMKRTTIWNDVDPDRSMLPPGLFAPSYGFADYARTALTAPIVLFDKDGVVSYAGQAGAAEVYDTEQLHKADIEHILSMLFFDVRLRNYVEIRCADSMPFPYALAYAALIKGLFYDRDNLVELADKFRHFDEDSVPAIKAALVRDGYDADLEAYYGECVQTSLLDLLNRARAGLLLLAEDRPEEAASLNLFQDLVERTTTLAREQS